jgi:hypothetical protein
MRQSPSFVRPQIGQGLRFDEAFQRSMLVCACWTLGQQGWARGTLSLFFACGPATIAYSHKCDSFGECHMDTATEAARIARRLFSGLKINWTELEKRGVFPPPPGREEAVNAARKSYAAKKAAKEAPSTSTPKAKQTQRT